MEFHKFNDDDFEDQKISTFSASEFQLYLSWKLPVEAKTAKSNVCQSESDWDFSDYGWGRDLTGLSLVQKFKILAWPSLRSQKRLTGRLIVGLSCGVIPYQ